MASLSYNSVRPERIDRSLSKVGGRWVNDIHSQLNRTWVNRVVKVDSIGSIQQTIIYARNAGKEICIAGGRHAMGGQQFASDAILIDTTGLNRVLRFDCQRGTIEVEAGIHWPELINYLNTAERNSTYSWSITQKQTGADRLSIGGALAANIHGRGLFFKPFIQDIESFLLIDARGLLLRCSRQENSDLFRLAIGGYGLFGIIYSVTLRLVPRKKIKRYVEIEVIENLICAVNKRIDDGFTYGDFQFSTDETSEDFLRKGVFSSYRPIDTDIPIPTDQKKLSADDWKNLLMLAHIDKGKAFQIYSDFYLSSSNQLYYSDTHQLSIYIDDYHCDMDLKLGTVNPASEIITEIFVPRDMLEEFMRIVRVDFIDNDVNLIYGTIRMIERDDEIYLAWAKRAYACVIFNLHTEHTNEGIAHTKEAFRRLIDIAIYFGGSYYLTYHKFATRRQVQACYPEFRAFLRQKMLYDPEERFQSDWYRHHKSLFTEKNFATVHA